MFKLSGWRRASARCLHRYILEIRPNVTSQAGESIIRKSMLRREEFPFVKDGEANRFRRKVWPGVGRARSNEETMNLHCLMHHEWDGCRCRRCGFSRDEHHDWDGCTCRRCGLVRDEGHEVATIRCRVTCRRCGWHFEWNHDWAGCTCRVCGKEQHVWAAGHCQMCGYPKKSVHCGGETSTSTVNGDFALICERCGLALDGVGRDGLPRPG